MAQMPPVNRERNYGLAPFGVAFFVFIASLLFAPFYFAGDQVFYGLAYKDMAGRELIEAYSVYPKYMSSREVVHFLAVWLASGLGIEKNLVMATVNSLLSFFLMRLFEQWRVSLIVALAICITNFYVLVLYFAAERLKFGILFFVMSVYACYICDKKRSFFFSFLAIIAHVQLLIPYTSVLFSRLFSISNILYLSKININRRYKYIFIHFFAFGVTAILIWNLLSYQIVSKFVYYSTVQSQKRDFFDFARVICFFCLTFLYTTKHYDVVLKFLPIFFAVYLLGGDGVNLFAYAIFMSYALTYKRGLNFGVFITSIYFASKSVGFIGRIIETGQGF